MHADINKWYKQVAQIFSGQCIIAPSRSDLSDYFELGLTPREAYDNWQREHAVQEVATETVKADQPVAVHTHEEPVNPIVDLAQSVSEPEVHSQHMLSRIASKTFTVMPSSTAVVCELMSVNGFTVRGEAALNDHSVDGYDASKAKAYNDAIKKLKPFEAYLIRENEYQKTKERKVTEDTVLLLKQEEEKQALENNSETDDE